MRRPLLSIYSKREDTDHEPYSAEIGAAFLHSVQFCMKVTPSKAFHIYCMLFLSHIKGYIQLQHQCQIQLEEEKCQRIDGIYLFINTDVYDMWKSGEKLDYSNRIQIPTEQNKHAKY